MCFSNLRAILILLTISLSIFPSLLYSEILNVPDDFETIQGGIDESEDGDTVLVQPGEYVENISFEGKAIVVGSLILTTGDEAYIDSTVIDGDENGSVVRFDHEENENSILIGFTLTNGTGSEDMEGDIAGGGIYCEDSGPTISHCVITDNTADLGGAMYIIAYLDVEAPGPTLVNCIISENSAEEGGGIYGNGEEFILANCSVSNNSSENVGGGIYGEYCDIILDNCLISGNTTEGDGGGLYCDPVYLVVFNCTISGNLASHGAGIFGRRQSSIKTVNSILWDNTSNELNLISRGGIRLLIAFSDIEGGRDAAVIVDPGEVNWLENNIDDDPLFVNPDEDDFRLTEDSPCVDAGTALFVWEEDTLLNLSEDNYYSFAPDMGAFESEFVNSTPDPFSPHPSSLILHKPYPNPFNSVIKITYSLAAPEMVSLEVYNPAGQRVTTLFSGYRQTGVHTENLNASGLPTGLYFVRLEASGEVLTRKVLLMK